MRAYSLDLRQRVLKVYDEGRLNIGQVAERFGVGCWWVHKLKRQREKLGDIAPRKGKVGKPRSLRGNQIKSLELYVRKHPDASLVEIHEHLNAPCTVITIHNTLRRLGYTVKKNSTGKRTRST